MTGKDNTFYRIMEMIPGATVWMTFVLAIILSIFKPLWVIYFVILFSLFWLFRVVNFVIYVIYAWIQYKRALGIDWNQQASELPNYHDIYHLVMLPTYKEPFEVIDETISHIQNSRYEKDKIIVCLAGEERDKENFLTIANQIKEKYDGVFSKLIVTVHPDGLPNEIKGKSANMSWAIAQVREYIDEQHIPYDNIIVSAFDCDTIMHEKYLAHLTYKYLKADKPTRQSYQPVILYNNNIWQAPAITRIAAFGSTFWLMTELARPERIVTFSSHSMSFRMLVDVGYWQKDIVSEDSRIFFQGFMKYDGDYRVEPLYIPVSLDTVISQTYWKSLVGLYIQQRRWAWGVEHFPYLIWEFLHNKKISLSSKVYHLYKQFEGMFTWAVVPVLLLVLARLPFWLSGDKIKHTFLAQSAPQFVNIILTLAMAGLFVSLAISMLLLPERPEDEKRHKYLIMILQWALLPLTLIIFGSFPAIDAQTRLMLGKYLGFAVTEKTREQS